MGKHLYEMTLEELWQLFPIFLVAPKTEWKSQYKEEERLLISLLPPDKTVRISHIGSTSIEGIWAKDIVDVLIELADAESLAEAGEILSKNGYICMSSEASRIDLNKGYTDDGFADKVFHIHLRIEGDNDELYFRDYMNDRPDSAKQYEALKLELWHEYEHDRDGYTAAKTDFIARCTAEAKELYKGRY